MSLTKLFNLSQDSRKQNFGLALFQTSLRIRLTIMFTLVALVPLAVAALFGYWHARSSLVNLALAQIEHETKTATRDIETYLGQFSNEILTFSKMPAIQGIIRAKDNNGVDPIDYDSYPVWVDRLTQIFAVEMGTKKYYQQLRYIDENGDEMVRVDYRNDRIIIISGTDQLQNKGQSDYVIKASQLKDGEVYISPLNLNREHGQIEEPHVPVIRFSTPIYDPDGNFRGVVVSNVYAAIVLERLNAEAGQIYLVNEEGYYLLHPDSTKTFGFDLGTDYTIHNDFNQTYLNLIESGHNIYTELDKTRAEGVSLGMVHFDPLTPERYWLLIRTIPEQNILAVANKLSLQVLGAALLLGVVVMVLAVWLTRPIALPVLAMSQAADKLAEGAVDQDISVESNDEIGRLGHAFRKMIAYMQDMTQTAHQLANGDLTVKVTPKSDADALGNAFAQMTTNLSYLVGQVMNNADQLNLASGQLAAITEQAGQATQQIAASTQEQATGINHSFTLTTEISTMIQQVATNAQTGAERAAMAAQVARDGAMTVESNINMMQSVRAKVGHSAQRVREMGYRSEQIGAIIKTIDDIASQTNLLALNAAIEAARAGEHGKGFAVVADEVRKLAEKSAIATQEIAELIKEIQHTVSEAITAMEEGAFEVEAGVTQVNKSGQALVHILETAEAVNQQVEEIAEAAQQMTESSNELVNSMDSISAMVEENSAATEEMAAQVEEVSGSTQTMKEMAQQLQELIAQFKLNSIHLPQPTSSKLTRTIKAEVSAPVKGIDLECQPTNGHYKKRNGVSSQ